VKVIFDQNMSPAMARAFRELFRNEHDIATLAEKFEPNTPDVEWIGNLSREGQWAVISGDRRITRNHAEYHAFRNSNLIGLFLSQGLNKAPVVKQMERILALWPNIVTVCQTVQGGAMFELPMKRMLLRQLKI
jgi:PIN like domain